MLALAVVFLIVTVIQNIKIALVICSMVLLTTLNLVGFVFLTSTLFPDHGFVVEVNAISVMLSFIIGRQFDYLRRVVCGVHGPCLHFYVHPAWHTESEATENIRKYRIISVHWHWSN